MDMLTSFYSMTSFFTKYLKSGKITILQLNIQKLPHMEQKMKEWTYILQSFVYF